jgi:hypothetical protein
MLILLIRNDTTLSYLCTCRDVLPDNEQEETPIGNKGSDTSQTPPAPPEQIWEEEYKSVRAYTWGYTIEPSQKNDT